MGDITVALLGQDVVLYSTGRTEDTSSPWRFIKKTILVSKRRGVDDFISLNDGGSLQKMFAGQESLKHRE